MEKYYDVCWVCFPLRDGPDPLHGELAQARLRFFTGGRRAVRTENSLTVKGFSGRVKGRISQRSLYWKKTVKGVSGGSVVLEEAFGQKGGWLVVARDFRGLIVSRSFFDKSHRWLKSEYYEPWDSTTPRVVFSPQEDGGLLRRDWDGEKAAWRDTPLSPAPYRSGTAGQSLVDARLGPPQILMLTTKGELCFTPQPQARQREAALEEVSGGTMVLLPAWEVREGELLDGAEEGSSITFTSLEEYARIQPPPQQEAPAPTPEEPGQVPASLPAPSSPEEEFRPGSEEEPETGTESPPESPPLPDTEDQPEAPPPSDREDQSKEKPGQPPAHAGPAPQPDPPEEEAHTENVEAILAEAAAQRNASPASPPTGSLTGRGRSQQPSGMTSYEGEYHQGKRHGFGAYYYKDGNLCYVGSWKDDRRDGLGVSFRDSDHALHVAHWQEGQPQGLVSLFDKDGSLRYSGRIENGKKEGAGVMINGQDGTVFVGQWAGGEATGLGSAFDSQGRLLYYGGWKEGRRHGHGTEFDLSGGVVFDGEFRDGKYYNGVLYQKLKADASEACAGAPDSLPPKA